MNLFIKTNTRRFFAAATGAVALTLGGPVLADVDPENRGPYYEDDAWYDVSEWFDGNDYNPTDEVIGRWDDEVYNASEDTGGDTDNDRWFGYNERTDVDNWFWDYYDDGDLTYYDWNDDGVYNYAFRYLDTNGDGLYDGYYTYYDDDDNGSFDRIEYFWLNNTAGADKMLSSSSSTWNSRQLGSSKAQDVKGSVEKIKTAAVRNTQHMVVEMKTTSGQTCLVDLGPLQSLDGMDIAYGDSIQVRGPFSQIGDKKVLIADRVRSNGASTRIERTNRMAKGTIQDLHKAKIRGSKHVLAILERPNGKTCVVDLGLASRLDASLEEGDEIKVKGTMVHARDKRLLMAQTLHCDGDAFQIDRGQKQSRTSRAGS